MSKETEHADDDTPDDSPQFQTSANARGGWLLIGGFIAALAMLVGAEFIRRI